MTLTLLSCLVMKYIYPVFTPLVGMLNLLVDEGKVLAKV